MAETTITVVMIDSRSDTHPQWVSVAISSVKSQIYPVDLIVVDNREKSKTIGKCWNEAVREAKTEWILFMGDDDWLSPDYTQMLNYWASRVKAQWISSYMTIFREDKMSEISTIARMCTGMIKREYLLENPFNENLKHGIDREYHERAYNKGVYPFVIHYHYGYHYRQHDETRARENGAIPLKIEQGDIYVISRYEAHTRSIYQYFKNNDYSITLSNRFDGKIARSAKLIWCDWGDENAVTVGDFESNAQKILRIHAYEAFTDKIYHIPFHNFDQVIFVAEHIKEYVEKKIGKIENAMVIPNAVDLNAFTIAPGKQVNNKIAYAGELSRKKGLQLLIFIAEHFPGYAFHVAGKFNEPDMAEFFYNKAPANIFIEPFSYDLNTFFADKTYFLLPSPREGCPVTPLQAMASGLQPLIYGAVGMEKIFTNTEVFHNLNELSDLLERPVHFEDNRMFIHQNFNVDFIYPIWENLIGNISEYHQGKSKAENPGGFSNRVFIDAGIAQ